MMERKNRFTVEQISEARQINIIDFMVKKGYAFYPKGAYMVCNQHDSFVVKPNGSWFWNSKGIYGNNVIDYLEKIENMTFTEAIKYLLGSNIEKSDSKVAADKPPFILPKKAENFRRAFAYLNKTRGIDGQIISKLMQEHKIFETAEFHNCACVGFDEDGIAKHVAMWGTYSKEGKKPFKGEVASSDKTCGFHMVGTSKTVCVYESPIDAMSHATLVKMNGEDYLKNHRLALCCTWNGALDRFLKRHEMDKIVFCLDNDKAGNSASDKYIKHYYELGYDVGKISPNAKDFNDDLLNEIENQIIQGDIDNER